MNPRLAELLKRKQALGSAPTEEKPKRTPEVRIAREPGEPATDNPTVIKLFRKAKSKVGTSTHDVDRIVAIPISVEPTAEEIEEFNRKHVLAGAYKDGFRFNAAQVRAFMGYLEVGGGFYPIGVGNGKTAICLYTASLAYDKGLRKILLLVPSQVYPQLMKQDLSWSRKRFTLGLPVIGLGNMSSKQRRSRVKSKRRGLFVLPYSLLSVRDTEFMLKEISPELIIADEGHLLKNLSAAKTKRVVKLLEELKPEFVTMSGTITDKSIKDYAHLIRPALKEFSPLPLSDHTANDWACKLDSSATTGEESTGPLMPLIYWARNNFPGLKFAPSLAGFRKAYKHRLITTPGVVATTASGVKCSLVFTNTPAAEPRDYEGEGGEDLDRLIKQVEEEWVTPSGDEIEHAIHTYKWLYELTAGFYNNLFWPEPEVYAKRKGISAGQATDELSRAMIHHECKQIYSKALREFLQNCQLEQLDTPFLVGGHFHRVATGQVGLDPRIPEELCHLWLDVKDREWKGMPERDSEVVRVCDYKIVALLKWLESLPKRTLAKGGIVWVYHQGIGRWVFERMRDAGYNVLHCPAGPKHNEAILDSREEWIVASIKAHGTGKNLQHHENQYYFQWPRQATLAEQSLGRLHRQGQQADVLNVATNNTTGFDKLVMAACLNDALYIHQTTATPQKVIYGTYNPVPEVFPEAVLRERGLKPQQLDKAQHDLLVEKFNMAIDLGRAKS